VKQSACRKDITTKCIRLKTSYTVFRGEIVLSGKLIFSFMAVFVLSSFSFVVSVEADSLMWSQTYGGTGDDGAISLVATSDGGYALAGYTRSFGAGSYDFWLVKTDAYGDIEWNRAYGGGDMKWNRTYVGPYHEIAWSLVATSDGGYALAGPISVFGGDEYDADFWLVKTDEFGNMLWSRTYGGSNLDLAFSVIETSDGGYALAGETRSYGAGDSDFWLVKTDESGNMEWNQTYGRTYSDYAQVLVEISDGGYVIAGGRHNFEFDEGLADCWLVKTDADGNMVWNKTYEETRQNPARSLVATSDGGYAIAGESSINPEAGFWMAKTDAYGNMEWKQQYEGTAGPNPPSVIETSDGGYAIAVYTLLVKTDVNGNMEWNQTYDGGARSLVATSDGGYALAGQKGSDFWLVKTDEYGVVPEYSSWVFLSIMLVATFVIVIYKKKFFNDQP
jgi:hypothetical protein